MPRLRVLAALCTASLLLACPKKDDGGPGPQPSGLNCEVDLAALGVSTSDGNGASAGTIDDPAQLIGGQWALGAVGDTLIKNDRIKVIVQKPSRNIGPQPYGGNIIDADLVRPEGTPGKDQFGKVGILYAFGRTTVGREIKVVRDGSQGGSAVIAVNGDDTVNDFVNVQNMIVRLIGGSQKFVVNPEQPIGAKLTTYYVLNPGEQRVRVLTAFCNDTDDRVLAPVGDMVDRGGTVDFFNPGMCDGTMGTSDSCFVDPSPWFGYQGDAVAYGFRSWKTDDITKPENQNALLTVSGVSVTLTGGVDQQSLLQWLDASATKRNGNFVVPAHDKKVFLRDFIVGRDLGEVAKIAWTGTGAQLGEVEATVQYADGSPAPGVRVSVMDGNGKLATVMVADESGIARTTLPVASYTLQAGLYGWAPGTPSELSVSATAPAKATVKLGATRKLTINVKDPFNAPVPGKVTVLCNGKCSATTAYMRRFHELEQLPDNVAAISFVPATGMTEMQLPPGQYSVVVTRGPEWSAYPQTWPNAGEAVDLTSNDQTVNAVIAQVVDSAGWMSADLHVHSVNSADSSFRNELRVINFAAEGVDALCSTDHDFVTDFAPFVRSTGSEGVIASMVGLEITPFDWGHYNTYPIAATPELPNGGAFDWAGGEGATLRQGQMIDGVKATWPGAVVQMNHPRGALGSLTLMRVDTATLATHSPAEDFRMEPSPDATSSNTALFTTKFDALEIMNGSSVTKAHNVMNDWFTFLSRGIVRTGTATSDTHYALKNQGGYGRTYVDMGGRDTPAQFDANIFAAGIKAHHAFGTNGPFIKVTARKVVAGTPTGNPVGMGDTLSIGSGDQVEISVDIQGPEFMYFDTLELYTHANGREAYDGITNDQWPANRIAEVHTLPTGTTSLEPVIVNGQNFRRRHLTDTFTVSPTADSWYVVVLRDAGSTQTLFPLHFDGVSCSGGNCTAAESKPLAFSNPILVDADGSGAYDHPPMPTPPPSPRSWKPAPPPLTGDALLEALKQLAHSH